MQIAVDAVETAIELRCEREAEDPLLQVAEREAVTESDQPPARKPLLELLQRGANRNGTLAGPGPHQLADLLEPRGPARDVATPGRRLVRLLA